MLILKLEKTLDKIIPLMEGPEGILNLVGYSGKICFFVAILDFTHIYCNLAIKSSFNQCLGYENV